MSQLPLADATPLRITGTLFKDLVFAFEPQDIPDGARTLRTLRGNGAIIMDEVDDASLVLVDPEHPGALNLLREAADKVVLHYSWVNKSLNAGHPLVESSNWGDCKVTPDNINNDFCYVPPPTPSNLQLQTPRPTPENRSYNFSTPFRFSQGSAGITPPSSQSPYTPTPSHWNHDPTMQTPQLTLTNQLAPYNSQLMQPPSTFTPFPVSQPADTVTMVYGQQPPWPTFHPGTFGAMQPPTLEDFRRAYEVMAWFQRPAMYPQLPPPPTPVQPGSGFQLPPPPPAQNPPNTLGTHSGVAAVPETLPTATLSRQDTNDTLPDLGDPPGGSQPESSILPTSPQIQPAATPPPLPQDGGASLSTTSTLPQTHPKLFEHAAERPIKFFVPIILKVRGNIAGILRVTGGRFTDEVDEADYVVLGQWEEHYFDEVWYSAQDYNKPTVTPAFVIDSYKRGTLQDPDNYPTRGPEKPRKDEPRRLRSRPSTGNRRRRGGGRGGAGGASPLPKPSSVESGDPPKWLKHYKEAENTKSMQYIGAMFKKNAELTHDALAIHLHNKMSNHTINSWKRYCVYRRDTIEDLRKRAISNAEKKTASKDKDATDETEAESQEAIPQQAVLQQSAAQQVTPHQTTPQTTLPQTTPHQTTPHQTTPQLVIPPQATNSHESQPPPPYEKVANPEPVLVKTEPLDEDQLDFAFATDILSGWNANEESDAALWKRMGSMRPSITAPSWEAFCEKHRSRFEHFFANRSAQT